MPQLPDPQGPLGPWGSESDDGTGPGPSSGEKAAMSSVSESGRQL